MAKRLFQLVSANETGNVPYEDLTRESIIAARKLLMKVYSIDRKSAFQEKRQLKIDTPQYITDHFKNEGFDANVHFLRTDQVDIRSYKARGAATVMLETFTKALEHNMKVKSTGEGTLITKIKIVADSEGNHAQGVAKAVSLLNRYMQKAAWKRIFGDDIKELTADIYMSGNADQTKVENTKKLGGEYAQVLRADGKAYDVARQAAERATELLQSTGGKEMMVVYNPPFNSKDTAKGAGTLGVDIDQLLKDALNNKGIEADAVIAGLGGGGLSSGLKRYYQGTGTEVIPVATAYHPATIVGLIFGGEEISLRNTDRELSPIHVGGATILKGGNVTLEILKHAGGRVESAHPEQLAWLMNEYIVKELGYDNFDQYKSARLSGDETRKIPELAGLQSLAFLRNNPDYLKDKKNVVCVITGGNISLEGAEIDINEALITREHKEYPSNLKTSYYDPKDLVGSLKSVIGIVDDRKDIEDLKNNWTLTESEDGSRKFIHKHGSEKERVFLTNELENTLYLLTVRMIDRISNEVPNKIEAAKARADLRDLVQQCSEAGRFDSVETAVLLDRLKGQGRSHTAG